MRRHEQSRAILRLQAATRACRTRALLRRFRKLPRELQCKVCFYIREPLLLRLYHHRPIARAVARYVHSVPPIIWDAKEREQVKHAQYLMHKYKDILESTELGTEQVRWIVFVFRQLS